MLEVSSVGLEKNVELSSLISEIRSQADAFVFLSGGASRMRADHQRPLLAMFEALTLVAKGGAVSQSAMVAPRRGSWKQRDTHAASGAAFPLIGVAPSREVQPRGRHPSIRIILMS